MARPSRPLFAREYAHNFDDAQKALQSVSDSVTATRPPIVSGFSPEGHGPPDPDRAKMRVLVVEDDEDGARSLATLLRLHGYDPHVALDGAAALREAGRGQPDVVLLDIGLPGMDGYEVARRVREEAHGREPFIIAITGYGVEDDRSRSAAAGIDLHLLKPVDFVGLDRLLKRFEGLVLPPI
jgi:CheY-like chemotaxis protein